MQVYAVLLASAMLVSVPAHAATYLITYTGTVAGEDSGGIFGAPGALSGDFAAVFTLTTGLPNTGVYSDPHYAFTYGGSAISPFFDSPLTATLTINGVSKSFGEPRYASAGQRNGVNPGGGGPGTFFPYDNVGHSVTAANGDVVVIGLTSRVDDLVDTSDYTQPFDIVVGPMTLAEGVFRYSQGGKIAFGRLTPQRATLAIAGPAIPEPATWAMMIFGFAAVGAAIRGQRRRQAKVTFAFQP